jgi:hypothetical protein
MLQNLELEREEIDVATGAIVAEYLFSIERINQHDSVLTGRLYFTELITRLDF